MAIIYFSVVHFHDTETRGLHKWTKALLFAQFAFEVQHNHVDVRIPLRRGAHLDRLHDQDPRIGIVCRKRGRQMSEYADADLVGPVEENSTKHIHQSTY